MKAEDLINKHLTLEGGSDLAITDGRIYNAFLNAVKEAINYTRCCESDSELLLKKQSDWLMIHTKLEVENIVSFTEEFKQ
jgi:hypothetical protein